jgi:hypothetical protein
MSDFIKDACKSLAYTTNSFTTGDCFTNFRNKKDSDKAITVGAALVAAVGVGILMGVIPVIGPVISVPFALIAGLYTFARLNQPTGLESRLDRFRGKDKMKDVSWNDVWNRVKSLECFTEFEHLKQDKKTAILVLTGIAAVSVATITGAMLGGVPILGGIAALALGILAGLVVFSYLTSTAQGYGDRIKMLANDSSGEAQGLVGTVRGATQDALNTGTELLTIVAKKARNLFGLNATPSAEEPVPAASASGTYTARSS